MKATPRELRALGVWGVVSEKLGIDIYAISEGRIDEDEALEIEFDFKK